MRMQALEVHWLAAAVLAAAAGLARAQDDEPPAPQSSVTREEYLEGWFAETVTGDLEEALRHYRRAIDAATDPDLVARAWWRTAEIAAARGETELARQLLAQVEEQFPGSPAAALAKESARTLGASDRSPTERAQVEEARQLLREILLERPDPVPLAKLHVIFQRLSATQILEQYDGLGVDLEYALVQAKRELSRYVDTLTELVVAGRGPMSTAALNCLDPYAMEQTPEPLLALRDRPDLQPDLLIFLARRGEDAALQAAAALAGQPEVRRSAMTADAIREVLLPLTRNESPLARDMLETLFAEMVEEGRVSELVDLASYAHCVTALQFATPAAAWLLEQFPDFTPEQRLRIASSLNPRNRNQLQYPVSSYGPDLPPEVLEVLENDREPLVRAEGVLRLIVSKSPEKRTRGLSLLPSLPLESQPELLSAAVEQVEPPYTLDELLALPDAWMRRFVYYRALGGTYRTESLPFLTAPGRSRRDVLDHGLSREDTILVEVVLDSSWIGRLNQELPLSGRFQESPSALEIVLKELSAGNRPGFPDLLARLALLGARSESWELRNSAVVFAAKLWPGPARLETLPGQALEDPHPIVRRTALYSFPWGSFPREAQLTALTDPSTDLQLLALRKCQDAAVAGEALARTPLLRLEDLLLRQDFPLREHPAVIRRLWTTIPPTSPLALFLFERLKTLDVDVLLDGLTHVQEQITEQAYHHVAHNIPLPEGVPRYNSSSTGRKHLQDLLRERRDEVAAALQHVEIQRLVEQVYTLENAPLELGERLAALGAREPLREMALTEQTPRVAIAGARGLATLEDQEGLRFALQSRCRPGAIFTEAIRAGLMDEVLAVARTDPGQLAVALLETDPRRLVDVFRERPDLAREWRGNVAIHEALLDQLAELDDPDLLLRAVEFYGSPRAATLLVTGGHTPAVFEHLPRWKDDVQKAVVESLRQLTGIPAQLSQPPWPRFLEDQEALVQAWQSALESAPDR